MAPGLRHAAALVLAVVCLAAAAAAQVMDGQEVLRKVRATFESLNTLRARFSQTFEWKMVGERQTTTGTLVAAKGDRYHIETDEQLVVTDGKTVWNYAKANNQVIVDQLGKSADAPLLRDLMVRYAEGYKAELKGEEAVGERRCYLVELRPKEEAFMTMVRLWVDRSLWLPVRVEETDVNDNLHIYELRDVELNVAVPGSLFTFRVPAGAEVIDVR